MQEITGNLWNPATYLSSEGYVPPHPDAICITTNGSVTKEGRAVMGRGCAREAKERIKDIDFHLGFLIKTRGNIVQPLALVDLQRGHAQLVAFPVKPHGDYVHKDSANVVPHMRKAFKPGAWVPGWAVVADPNLIRKSAKELTRLATDCEWQTVILPRPGCGAGALSWEQIRPILQEELDDRFYVVTFRR